jgi:hypothetical protein
MREVHWGEETFGDCIWTVFLLYFIYELDELWKADLSLNATSLLIHNTGYWEYGGAGIFGKVPAVSCLWSADVTVSGQTRVCIGTLLYWEPDCGNQSKVIALEREGEVAKAQGTLREQVSKSETCPLSPAQPWLSG